MVIAIIAVLMALIFPVVGSMQRKALLAKSTSNMRQVLTVWTSFTAEHNGAILAADRCTIAGGQRPWYDLLAIHQADKPYSLSSKQMDDVRRNAGSAGIFSDPAATRETKAKMEADGSFKRDGWWSYSYNRFVGESSYATSGVHRLPQVDSLSRLVLFSVAIVGGKPSQILDNRVGDIAFYLYDGQVPVGFADGHVEMLNAKTFPAIDNGFFKGDPNEWKDYWWGSRIDQKLP